MRVAALLVLAAAGLAAACGTVDVPPPRAPRPAVEIPAAEWIDALAAGEPPALEPLPDAPDENGPGKDFIDEARILWRVAACASDAPLPPDLDARIVKAHCDEIRPEIDAYKRRYVAVAKPFLRKIVPAGLPSRVVYPFGGGDLATALLTYPDATEVTTVSLELAGDPRRIRGMPAAALDRSLSQLRRELAELYFTDDYSRSETLKRTQRGDIPGELVLFLVGLSIHGYEPVSVRYFTLGPDGAVHYLSEKAIAENDRSLASRRKATWWPPDFSESFANVEIAFRPAGAPKAEPVRVHRHIAQNLSDEALERSPLFRHLDQKGPVTGIVKAASYLLWKGAFSAIRDYLARHASFIVSDSTGIPPSIAARAGFALETYGSFQGSLLHASRAYNREFRSLWQSQPRRALPFRFGYLSGKQPHLVLYMKTAP